MFRCSSCTAGSSECLALDRKCNKCEVVLGHVCIACRCRSNGDVFTINCHKCQPHICLSKCSSRCIKKAFRVAPMCGCSIGPTRLKVQKEGYNKGRLFWTCRPCKFFEWDECVSKCKSEVVKAREAS